MAGTRGSGGRGRQETPTGAPNKSRQRWGVLQGSILAARCHSRSTCGLVARGGVEPPTFRFSGLGTTVHQVPLTSVTCIAALTRTPPNPDERTRMRPKMSPSGLPLPRRDLARGGVEDAASPDRRLAVSLSCNRATSTPVLPATSLATVPHRRTVNPHLPAISGDGGQSGPIRAATNAVTSPVWPVRVWRAVQVIGSQIHPSSSSPREASQEPSRAANA